MKIWEQVAEPIFFNIFQATSLTPWIWALIPLIGIGVSIPLIITQQWFYLFVPFVGSQIIVQPLHAIYAIKRKRGLRRALTDWNRLECVILE